MFRPFGSGGTGNNNNNNTSQTPFGTPQPAQSSTGFGFGASGNQSSGGGMFGQQSQQANTSSAFGASRAFGASASNAFGASANIGSQPSYTTTTDRDSKDNNVQVTLTTITAMPAYCHQSLEELRLADYMAGRKGSAAPFGAIGTKPPTSTGFGGFGGTGTTINTAPSTGFGANTGFGATSARPSFGLGVGHSTTSFQSPGMATSTTGGTFGQQQPARQGLFGSTPSTSAFGASSTNQPKPFGAGVGGGSFGATSTTPAFGATSGGFGGGLTGGSRPSAFGQSQTNVGGGFGAFGTPKPAQPFGIQSQQSSATGFGTQPGSSSGGGFGAPSSTLQFGAGSLQQPPPTSTGLFGQSNVPKPPPTSTPFSFGAGAAPQTNSFGAQSSAQGNTGSSNQFGAQPSAQPSQQQPFSFGAQSNTQSKPAPFSFGSTTASSTQPSATTNQFQQAPTSTFSFGGANQSQQQPNQQSSSFSFNLPSATSHLPLNPTNTAGSAPKPFSFGTQTSTQQQQQQQAPGSSFSFNAPFSASNTTTATNIPQSNLPLIPSESLSMKPPIPAGLITPSGSKVKDVDGVGKAKITSESRPPTASFASRSSFKLQPPPTSFASGYESSSGNLFSATGFALPPRRVSAKKLVLTGKRDGSAAAQKRESTLVSNNPSSMSLNAFVTAENNNVISPSDPKFGECFMIPNETTLKRLPYSQLSAVKNFIIGQRGIGQIRFLKPVDLTKISLSDIFEKIVVFEPRQVTVYPDDEFKEKPTVGSGLNVPAEIRLERCWPLKKSDRTPIKDMDSDRVKNHIERLKNISDSQFIDYHPDTGTWIFRVEHF